MKLSKLISTFIVLLAALAVLVPSVAAQDGDDTDTEDQAYVRYANLRSDEMGSDVYVNGEMSDVANLESEGFSDWMAVPAGTHTVSVTNNGMTPEESGVEPTEFEVQAGQWVTIITTGSAADGTLQTFAVPQDVQELVPGTSMITFVNALNGETRINFDRDEVPFVTELAPPGNEEGLQSVTSIPVDSEVYNFTVYPTGEPENVIGQEEELDVIATNYYILAAVEGADGQMLYVDSTRYAEILMARGDLEAPGTIVEAARATELLTPYLQLLEETGLSEELSGEGPYTVFAPADFAVDEARSRFGDDTEALTNWLRGYIVEDDLKFGTIYDTDTLTAMNGATLDIAQAGNTATVNGAEILTPNVAATNGTIHIIGAAPQG